MDSEGNGKGKDGPRGGQGVSRAEAVVDTPERMAARKNDHIRICTREAVESAGEPFSRLRLLPDAIPDLDLKDVDLSRTFLGRSFSLPFLITGMTGGVERGEEINATLALAAEKHGIPMGLGSQKILVRKPDLKGMFDVRKVAPGVFLMGNMGLVSFNHGITVDDVRRLVDSLRLDAFALHVNALQECVQPEGERNFRGLLTVLETLVRSLVVPVVVKEVGSGMSAATFRQLAACGVAAVDVGGRGGTSWSVIEGMRGDSQTRRLGDLFRDWGLTTEESLAACVRARKDQNSAVEIVATGGIRDGLQAAKAIATGARMVGVGLPFFKAVVSPPQGMAPGEALDLEIDFFRRSLAIAMFCSGARRLADLESRVYAERNDE